MPEAAPEYVWVLGLPGGDDDEDDRSIFFRRDDVRVGRQPVPTDRLRKNMSEFIAAMQETIRGVPDVLGAYAVESIELSAEVSATGTVSLLGTGGEVSGSGGITISLKRVSTSG